MFLTCYWLHPATNDRAARRQRLEAEMEADGLPEEQRQAMRQRCAASCMAHMLARADGLIKVI